MRILGSSTAKDSFRPCPRPAEIGWWAATTAMSHGSIYYVEQIAFGITQWRMGIVSSLDTRVYLCTDMSWRQALPRLLPLPHKLDRQGCAVNDLAPPGSSFHSNFLFFTKLSLHLYAFWPEAYIKSWLTRPASTYILHYGSDLYCLI